MKVNNSQYSSSLELYIRLLCMEYTAAGLSKDICNSDDHYAKKGHCFIS